MRSCTEQRRSWQETTPKSCSTTSFIPWTITAAFCGRVLSVPKEHFVREYDREPRIFLVALNSQFDLKRNTDYYDETTFGSVTALNDDGTTQKIAEFNDTFLSTILKMQIFYRDLSDEDKFGAMSRWSAAVGFPYPIRVDLENGTAEYLEKIDIIRS